MSLAFTPDASISPTLRAKVTAAVARLGYRSNLLPRMMLNGRLGFIALVAGWAYNPLHAAMLEAFGRALQAAGKKIMLIQIEDDRALDMIVDDLAGCRIDGVVSALSILSEEAAAAISARPIPVILLNSGLISDWVRVVEANNRGAGRAAARVLVDVAPVALPRAGGRSVASSAR